VVGIFKNLNYNIGKQNSVDPKGRTRGKWHEFKNNIFLLPSKIKCYVFHNWRNERLKILKIDAWGKCQKWIEYCRVREESTNWQILWINWSVSCFLATEIVNIRELLESPVPHPPPTPILSPLKICWNLIILLHSFCIHIHSPVNLIVWTLTKKMAINLAKMFGHSKGESDAISTPLHHKSSYILLIKSL
jgi:hypothetical protein